MGLPPIAAGKGGVGKGLSDPRIAVGLYIFSELLASFRKQQLRPGWRKIGRGAWSKVGDLTSTNSINPDSYQFYAQHKNSLRDDGTGDYAGASAYIKNPATFAKMILCEFGGLSTSDIQTGAGVFGAFDQAATDLDALVTGDWEIIYRHLQQGTVGSALQRLMGQAPMAFWQSQRTGKWMAEVFKRTPAARQKFKDAAGNVYKWKYLSDLLPYGEPVFTFTPPDEVLNEVHIHYALSAFTGQYTRDCWVGPDGSDDGTGTRDQTGAIGTSTDREIRATDSRNDWHVYNVHHVYADQIYRPEQAKVLRDYIFDMAYRPRMLAALPTWNLAAGLEPNMVTYIENSQELLDDYGVPRYPGHGGSQIGWDSIPWLVTDFPRVSEGGRTRYVLNLEEIL